MRKIIDGIRYDTDKAIKIGEYSSPQPVTDFTWWQATLYRTPRSGRHFLAGEGGPMTSFAQPSALGGMSYGSKVTPLSRQDALEWAEQFLDPDVIEAEFGDLIQDA